MIIDITVSSVFGICICTLQSSKTVQYNNFFLHINPVICITFVQTSQPCRELRKEPAALCYCSSHSPVVASTCAAFWKPQALSCVWFRTFLSSYMIAILAAPIDGFWVSRQEVDFLRLVRCLKSLLRTDKYLPVKIGGYLLNETRVWSYSLKFSYRGGGCLCLCSLNQNMNTAFILSWVYFFELLLLFTSQTLLYNGFLFVSRDSSK